MVLGFSSTFLTGAVDYNYVSAIFFGTLSVYSLHRWFSFTKRRTDQNDLRKIHINRLRKVLPFMAVISLIPAVFFYIKCSYDNYFLPTPVFLLTTAYLLPLFSGRRIRDLPYIKIWIVSFSWAWLGIWIPLKENQSDPVHSFLLFSAYFLFIFALILPMDFRDKRTDLLSQTHSLSNILSLQRLRLLGLSILTLSMLIFIISGSIIRIPPVVYIAYGSGILAAGIITLVYNERSHDLLYSLYLDGTILLQGLFLYLVSFSVSD